MKIGIISDTHGNLSVTGKAVDVFRARAVSAIFHCGDIGSVEVLTELAKLSVPIHAVLGNVDQFSNDWKYAPTYAGLQLHGRFGVIEMAGCRIALLHSDDSAAMNRAIRSREYDFIFTGHTHVFHDYALKVTRCINPGTAGRGAPNTCAVLDLATGLLEKLDL